MAPSSCASRSTSAWIFPEISHPPEISTTALVQRWGKNDEKGWKLGELMNEVHVPSLPKQLSRTWPWMSWMFDVSHLLDGASWAASATSLKHHQKHGHGTDLVVQESMCLLLCRASGKRGPRIGLHRMMLPVPVEALTIDYHLHVSASPTMQSQ